MSHSRRSPFPSGAEVYVADIPEFRDQIVREAERRLQDLARTIAGATSEVMVGQPARRITEAATACRADVIVIGTHTRGAVAQFLMGSVADRVVRTATCPVLTIRQPVQTAPRPSPA